MSEQNNNFISVDELKLLVHKESGYRIQIGDNDPILTTIYINKAVLGAALGEAGELQKKTLDLIERLPGVADKEMERAGEKAITALADQVGYIANKIAGDTAAATAADARSTAAKWQGGMLVVGMLIGVTGTYLAVTGANAMNMSTARDRVAAAEMRAETAEADAKKRADDAIAAITEKSGAAVAAVAARNTWAASTTGQLAKQFFDSGTGLAAATCKSPVWEIKEMKNGKFCVPKRREFFGDSEEYGWKIP